MQWPIEKGQKDKQWCIQNITQIDHHEPN
jgi:hypothetical protein